MRMMVNILHIAGPSHIWYRVPLIPFLAAQQMLTPYIKGSFYQ